MRQPLFALLVKTFRISVAFSMAGLPLGVGCSSPRGALVSAAPGGASPSSSARASVRTAQDLASEPPDVRAESLLGQMTLEEKLEYIGGERSMFIRPVRRLGIPEIKMSDGPVGCRNWGPSTAYPASVGIAASFDSELSQRVGKAMARDCRARGVHILLAPGVNIHRSPRTGRNFEYRGEDPFLAGESATAFVRGVQGEGVLATVKHFAANNQEWDRNLTSSDVDERTLREIYFPAFERTVREGGVGAVMTAYNLLNGVYCSHHSWLLNDVLKKDWGFRGFVMSDWSAVHDSAGAVNGGCDLEMPSGLYMNPEKVLPLIANKTVDVASIDDKVRRILRTLAGAGFLDAPRVPTPGIPLDDPTSAAVALEAARGSIVLLKNVAALLPLDATKLKRLAVIGPNAHPAVVSGSGSAFTIPFRSVSLLDGLKQALPKVELLHHPGVRQASEAGLLGQPCFTGPVRQERFEGVGFSGKAVRESTVDRIDFLPNDSYKEGALPPENYSIRWSGTVTAQKAGKYKLVTNTDDGVRVFLDGKLVIDDWVEHAPKTNVHAIDLAAGPHAVIVEYYQGKGGARAQFGFYPEARKLLDGGDEVAAVARRADAVILSVGFGQTGETNSVRARFEGFWPPDWARQSGLVESEDSDRPFELPPSQIETIRRVLAVNPRAIVIVGAGSAVDVQPFLDRVPALLWAWYPGQEGGHALADVLLGKVNPSGKLPITFAKRYADYPSAPYYNVNQNRRTPYTEGLLVGYRGFDAQGVEPAFSFGHGLSYTDFEYTALSIERRPEGAAQVEFKLKNTGARAGAEAAQIYVAPPASKVVRAPKELRGYSRVSLLPGETKLVTVTLPPRAFAYWDQQSRGFRVDEGSYEILVASSSRNVRLRGRVALSAQMAPK